mgnify:CR=1 FL=1
MMNLMWVKEKNKIYFIKEVCEDLICDKNKK